MAEVDQLAQLASEASYDGLSTDVVRALKIRILDSLGCALGALGAAPTEAVRSQIEELGGRPLCGLIGGGRNAPDRAALYNGGLIRYLDFNDAFLAPGETCHPSDSLGALLAAVEAGGMSGKDLLVALAVAYEVQCRLSKAAPVRDRGFDHTVQLVPAVAAGASRALRLAAAETANAISIAVTSLNALRVTRTGRLSQWKGLAAPHAAARALGAVYLAREGVTGPREVFEGPKGLRQALTGPFDIDWARGGLRAVEETSLKRYNAEVHGQSAVEALLWLRAERGLRAEQIERLEVDVFDVAFRIIGGGEEGEKTSVRTKEEADHSLPYLLAAALLDGQLLPAQFSPERIVRDDVQSLLRRIHIQPDEGLSRRFPMELPCRVTATLHDGRTLAREQGDYEGFRSRPMRWPTVLAKFDQLASKAAGPTLRNQLVRSIDRLEDEGVGGLVQLLGRAQVTPHPGAPHEPS